MREGHLEATRVLLEAGADPTAVGLRGEDLVTVARDRSHEAVARLLEEVAACRSGSALLAPAPSDPEVHAAARAGDRAMVEALLDCGADQLLRVCGHRPEPGDEPGRSSARPCYPRQPSRR